MKPDILSFHPFMSHRAIIPTNTIVIGLKSEGIATDIAANAINPTIGIRNGGIIAFVIGCEAFADCGDWVPG
jgi:hypothetical protein